MTRHWGRTLRRYQPWIDLAYLGLAAVLWWRLGFGWAMAWLVGAPVLLVGVHLWWRRRHPLGGLTP